VVLCGLPGSGKSTLGRYLAQRFGLLHFDSDWEVERRVGMSVSEFFAGHGEEAFRELESSVLAELVGTHDDGRIVSVGGGSLQRPANRRVVAARARTLYLAPPLALLQTRLARDDTRPLLRGGGLAERLQSLHLVRHAQFLEVADAILSAADPREEAASLVSGWLGHSAV
jgi:shikimate kinase